MPALQKQNIFISHSSVNKKVTDELYQVLTDQFHLTCWMDNFDLQTEGGTFSAQIVTALRNASLLVLVDSPAARASDYVLREIQTAKDLQIPIRRCSISEDQAPWLRKIRIQWLALTIQLRLARGFIFAALSLFLFLAVVIFLLITWVAPAIAKPFQRDLPDPSFQSQTYTAIPTISDPKVAAPFHFNPDIILLQDDFNDPAFENSIKDQTKSFKVYLGGGGSEVNLNQLDGSLVIFFPVDCLIDERLMGCEIELDSNILDAREIQYFGMRARTAARTYLRGVTVSISINEFLRSQAGFGWNFSEHVMAFFRSIPELPEKENYDIVSIDTGWHAYEIIRDPKKSAYYYYIDGQLVNVYNPVHASEWDQAPLRLIIYSMNGKGINPSGGAVNDTRFEIDEFVVGGFNNP